MRFVDKIPRPQFETPSQRPYLPQLPECRRLHSYWCDLMIQSLTCSSSLRPKISKGPPQPQNTNINEKLHSKWSQWLQNIGKKFWASLRKFGMFLDNKMDFVRPGSPRIMSLAPKIQWPIFYCWYCDQKIWNIILLLFQWNIFFSEVEKGVWGQRGVEISPILSIFLVF